MISAFWSRQDVVSPDSPELSIDGGDFEIWTWRSEDNTILSSTRNFDVPDLGNYSLMVTQTMNGLTCEKEIEFEVVSSGAPENFTTTTDGISDLVTLSNK